VGTDKKERQDRDQEKPWHIGESARGIGGVMVALLWLYFSGLAILLGGTTECDDRSRLATCWAGGAEGGLTSHPPAGFSGLAQLSRACRPSPISSIV
jgi:hypothetical protein